MNKQIFMVLILGIMVLVPLSNATSINSSSIYAQVPIVIKNSQNVSTPAPFQQMINITESNYSPYLNYSGNEANFEFLSNKTNTSSFIPAWIGSNDSGKLTVWLKLNKSIAADSNTTVYLTFASPSTNLLNSSGIEGIGEAPELSPQYAEYDDGASVFNNYWNFAGTSLPSGLTIGETSGTYSVNNGLTITGGSGYEGIFSTSSINPQTTITDFYGYLTGTGNYNSQFGLYGNTSAGDPQYFIWTPVADNYSLLTYDGTIGTKTTITTSGSQTSSSVWSVWASTTYAYASYNYGTAVSNNANFVASTAQYIGIQAKSTSNGAFVQWLRVRAYPPNGVMPTTTFEPLNIIKLTAEPIIPENPIIEKGGSVKLESNAAGGTTPYTYQWYTAPAAGTCSTNDTAISGATSQNYTASPTSDTYYCYIVKDADNSTADSQTDLVSVYSINAYIPITITNNQSVNTSAPFQQMIIINATKYAALLNYSGNEANFEFANSNTTNATIIPAWIESENSSKIVAWVRLANGIPANVIKNIGR